MPGEPSDSTPLDRDGPFVVRIFVSSTFLDMQRERDILVRQVFPALRARLRERGVDLLEVDLRWGITQAQAESGQTLSICLSEIDRCRPYFIGLIGERYGWVPPEALLTDEVQDAFPAVAGATGRSVTELEVLHGVSSDPVAAGNALFFMRDPAWIETLDPAERSAYVPADDVARDKHAAFKARIEASGASVIRYPSPDDIGAAVEGALGALLDRRFPAAITVDPYTRAHRLHEAYARERRALHVGADEVVAQLDAWGQTDGPPPLVVVGATGTGKSAMIANWLHGWRARRPSDIVFEHYLGASPDSADPVLLMRRLWTFCDRATDDAVPAPAPDASLMDVSAGLTERLARAAAVADRRGVNFIIALDGLDKLSREGNLRWWPRTLSPSIRLIASGGASDALDAARGRGWSTVELPPLTRADGAAFIERLLAAWGRRLSPARVDRILDHPLAGQPLFLIRVLEELRYSATHERLDERLDFYLDASTMPALFARLLDRLESDIGAEAATALLRPLWASRAGLEEADMIQVAGQAPLTWAALRNGLGSGLRDQQGRMTFNHEFLRAAVQQRYLPEAEVETAARLALADHFAAGPWTERRAEEVPYQLRAAQAWDRLETVLVDLDGFEDLRSRGDVALLGDWLALTARGVSLEGRLADAFSARTGAPAEWSEADLSLALALSSFFDVAGVRGRAALALDEAYTAACEARFGPTDPRTLDGRGRLAETMFARGDLQGARDLWTDVLEAQRRGLGDDHAETLATLSNLAQAHRARGELDDAEDLQHQALDAKRRVLGPEHADTLTSLNNLADIKAARGDLEAAQAMFETLAEASARQLGPDHPDALTALHNLAGVMKDRGDLKGALTLERQVLEARQQLLGPDHPSTLISVNNLAAGLLAAGDLAGAQALQQQVTDAVLRIAGPDHPDTFIALNNLAQTLDDRGDMQGAVALFERAIDGSTRVLGCAHPTTLSILNNLAESLKSRGDLRRSLSLQDEVFEHRQQVSGPDHPDTLTVLNNMAHTQLVVGDLSRAADLAERAVDALTQKLGPDHPDTLVAEHNLASARLGRGDLAGATRSFERVHAVRVRALGADHPDTLTAVTGVAQVRQAQGDLPGAVALYREAYDARARQLGEHHADALEAAAALGGALRAAGHLTESEDLLSAAANRAGERHGADHRATLTATVQLASTLKARGDLDSALPLEEHAYEGWRRRYGPLHPETLTSRNNLAQTLYSRGDYDQALAHFEKVLQARADVNGPDHPDSLLAVVNLAQTKKGLGDIDGAQALEEQALEGLLRVVGPDHPLTLATKSNLVGTYRYRQDNVRARDLEAEVLQVRRRVSGVDHPDTLRSLNALGELHYALGDLDAAVDHLRPSLEGRQRVLGLDHPDTLTTQMSLGAVVWAAGDLDQAESLFTEAYGRCLARFGPQHALTTHASGALSALAQVKRPGGASR